MQIAIDARPLQLDAYKNRGIGTHLRGWIEAVQSLSTNDHFTLLSDPQLPAPEIHLTSPCWSTQTLTLPFAPPMRPATELHIDRDEEFVFDSATEALLLDREYDLYHATYNFMWDAYGVRRLYRTRWIVTIYDLIPLVFHTEYLDPLGERARQSFAQRLGAVVYAQRLQTLSAASRNDLVKLAGIAPNGIDVLYGGIDAAYRPLPEAEVHKTIGEFRVRQPYIFSVVGFHHTKNLRRQIEAFSLLPAELRTELQLVIRYPGGPAAAQIMREWLQELQIADQTVLLEQDISLSQLVALYNGAAVVLHATLFEGLGLPVLEAMRCGTPVVTSNVSALPEVAGDAAELVNPYQVTDIARGLKRVLSSTMLRSEMRERGFKQAAPFTWERTAQTVLQSYQLAAQLEPSAQRQFFAVSLTPPARRLRLSFWAPINPKPSGVSDYSEMLLSELGKYAEIEVYLDGYQPSNLPLFDSFPMYDGRAYPYVAQRHPYDMNLYQVGNNPLHGYMYQPILKWPGIVTFHDIYIYHCVYAALAQNGYAEPFWQEVEFCEGVAAANRARLDYMRGQLDDYAMMLNKRLVLASRGVITHSTWGMQRLQQYQGAPPGRVIPFGMLVLEDDGQRFGQLVRRFLRLPEQAFVFGVFGNLHRVKRIPVILQAFARLHQERPDTALFMMGPVDLSAAEAITALQRNPQQARAQGIYLRIAYASYDVMLMAMQAVDAGINLRFPTAGETSGTLSMLLGQGKPTLVSDIGSFTEYPDMACPKVPLDETEEEVLLQRLRTLVNDADQYRRAVQAAFEYGRQNTWENCARQYLELIEHVRRQGNTTAPA